MLGTRQAWGVLEVVSLVGWLRHPPGVVGLDDAAAADLAPRFFWVFLILFFSDSKFIHARTAA